MDRDYGDRIYGEVNVENMPDICLSESDKKYLGFLAAWAVDRLAVCLGKQPLCSYEKIREQADILLDESGK